jgi:hypothetical protein
VIELTHKDIAPFLSKPRYFDMERFHKIKDFLAKDLGFKHLNSRDGEWDVTGSCSIFFIYFDENWTNIEPNWEVADGSQFLIKIGVSARGPFVTGLGLELQPIPPDWYRHPNHPDTMLLHSDFVQEKAVKLSKEVGKKFDLTYLDPKWLAQIEIDVMDLAGDASLSLDAGDATAWNVLFSEYM